MSRKTTPIPPSAIDNRLTRIEQGILKVADLMKEHQSHETVMKEIDSVKGFLSELKGETGGTVQTPGETHSEVPPPAPPTEKHEDKFVTPAIEVPLHIAECPDCYVKSWKDAYSKKPYECKDCGLPLGGEMLGKENCPNCGGKTLRRRKTKAKH